VFALVGCMSVYGRRGDDASDNNHVGAVVPEEREEEHMMATGQLVLV